MKKDGHWPLPDRLPQPPVIDIRVAAARQPPLVRSRELLDADGQLLIDHNGKLYLLRSLPGGRLILTGWRAQVPPAPSLIR